MKKLSLLLIAAAVAVSASAGVNFKANHALKTNKLSAMQPKASLAQLQGATRFGVITAQPEGELKSYDRAGQYLYVNNGYLYPGQQDGNRMDVVYGEDGKVYMKNVICGIGSYFGDSWVEGTIEGNEIHVALGQSIYYSDDYQADVVLVWGSSHGGEAENTIYFDVDDTVTEAVYVIDGETITLQGSEGPTGADSSNIEDYFGTGLSCQWSDDDSWGGFIEWNTVLTEREPFVTPTVITEQPEGQLYTYARQSACIYNSWMGIGQMATNGKINIVFGQNGKVYIQNPMWWHDSYNTWVEGTYDWMTGLITIPTGQYLTYNEAYEYGIQLVWGSTYVYTDVDDEGNEGYYMGTMIDERTDEIYFQIDDDCFYLLGSEGDINAEFPENYNCTGMMGIYSDDNSMTNLEFALRDEYGRALPFGKLLVVRPAVPANPVAVAFTDGGDEDGYTYFNFTLPTEDVDGNAIDQEYLSYSIYVDNGNGPELFVFDAATYSYDLSEDMTEIPAWIYQGGYDFNAGYCYFYRTNAEGFDPLFTQNIGIQVFYTVDGVKNASEIVWLYDVQSSVDEMVAGKTVASVRYFNVAGQEMAQPNGMTIQVTTYTDGTKSAVKVVK